LLDRKTDGVIAGNVLERGRASYAKSAWLDAYELLSRADEDDLLEPEDLELLGQSAYLLGRDDDYVRALERAHHGHLDAGDVPSAARCTWWIGLNLLMRGETAGANGWFGRGNRLLEREARECAARGYLVLAVMLDAFARGDAETAAALAAEAAAIGERFGDRDLATIGRMDEGHALLLQGKTEEGFRLIDETMVAVTTGELSPIVVGIVYCNTISVCRGAHEVRRAREWTNALTKWCDGQPDMVAHTGVCLVHRAEVMQLQGAWRAALEELGRADERLRQGVLNTRIAGSAFYRQGEIQRLQGELAAAEEAYVAASRLGFEPQPGLALLRLAQGNAAAAAAAIGRAADEMNEPFERAELLPACIEIMLAVGDGEGARRACDELNAISETHANDLLRALAAQAEGAVALAEGDARAALAPLRRALSTWQDIEAPYDAARTRVLLGMACRRLGDEDAAGLEVEAARSVFEELGAGPDLTRVASLVGSAPSKGVRGLSRRELEVLRHVAGGKTNREIATQLVLSERTVERHVSNIFGKLGVSTRAAATAFAYEHQLL
jgi:DNA-binding CsgD family transcriptional regulator/tetratricopeptide (TPR) repeat protein